MEKFKPGKIQPLLLSELLAGLEHDDERVVLKPAVGEDVCAIRMKDRYLVAKTDPITFATERIGWYVVHINANDIATSGAIPKWFLVTMLLPEHKTDECLVREIWADLKDALDSINCSLCGGHTEVTVGLERPVLVGHMLGEVALDALVDKSQAKAGDKVLLTKGVPIEGMAVMAHEKRELLDEAFPADVLEKSLNLLHVPGLSVIKEAQIACSVGGVSAMHDPTEGGVATGLWELAKACGLGMSVQKKDIRILEYGEKFCRELGLDPLGVLASGALLICARPEKAAEIINTLSESGIVCDEIGEMLPKEKGINLLIDDTQYDMPVFEQDEIGKLW